MPPIQPANGKSQHEVRKNDLSLRIKQLRSQRNLTLEELASRSGVTKGFLSLVESGAKGPSVSTLLRMSQSLQVPLAYFFDAAARRSDRSASIVRRRQRKPFDRMGSRYGYAYESIAYKKERKSMEPFVMSPPLKRVTEVFAHDGEELLFVLNGNIRLELDLKQTTLGVGDCAYYDASIPHRCWSIGKRRAVVLLVVSVGEHGVTRHSLPAVRK
jgi:transcriptional regulator with XRE-family HTH domain